MFTTTAPAVAVDALAAALTDPAPLRRDRDWMDEELLAHHERSVAERLDAPQAADAARRYSRHDLQYAAAQVIAHSLTWVDTDISTVRETIADLAVTGSSGGPTRWAALAVGEQELAAALVVDLVQDAARRTQLLTGLPTTFDDGPDPASDNFRVHPLDLRTVNFTNDDLYSAAAHVCALQIAWIDEPSGLAASMNELVIASTAGRPDWVFWEDLTPEERRHAHNEVRLLLDQASEPDKTRKLFTPALLRGHEPMITAGPVHLAGPGHDPHLATAPLREAGWTRTTHGPTTHTSPAGPGRPTVRSSTHGPDRTVTAHHPETGAELWRAAFAPATPPEIIAAFHSSIVDALARHPRTLLAPSTDLDAVFAPLRRARWKEAHVAGEVRLIEPHHGTAWLRRAVEPHRLAADTSEDWIINAGPPRHRDPMPNAWTARLSATIPGPLLAAVAARIVDPAGVPRLNRDIQEAHRPFLHTDALPARPVPVWPTGARIAAARTRSAPAATGPTTRGARTPPTGNGQPTRGR
ncbi:hypothetical protein ACWC5I_33830 [Kitasatospora sp. NPDC001574]